MRTKFSAGTDIRGTVQRRRPNETRRYVCVTAISRINDVWAHKHRPVVPAGFVGIFFLSRTFYILFSSKRDDCATSIFCIRARMRRVDSRR